jgi:twitching motility protein PilT
MANFNQLVTFAIEQRASDIFLAPKTPPIIRVDGNMKMLRVDALDSSEIGKIINDLMSDSQREAYKNELELDFAVDIENSIRCRASAFNTLNGYAACFRIIPKKIKTLAELQAPLILEGLANLHKGLVLVTGATGSGKSTTLAAMVNHINTNSDKHIITIEDPIEFVHKSKKSLVNQREVGTHTKSFERALKSSLRENPDVILIGEIRDVESMSLALTAAETGHLVLGTLHTSSTAQTVNRIIDIFPGGKQPMIRSMLTSSLEAIVTQRLFKKAGGAGRVGAFEIMVANNAVRNLIKEDKIPQISSLIQISSKDGMILMSDYIKKMVDNGILESNAIDEYTKTPNEIIHEQITQQLKNSPSPSSGITIDYSKDKTEEDF